MTAEKEEKGNVREGKSAAEMMKSYKTVADPVDTTTAIIMRKRRLEGILKRKWEVLDSCNSLDSMKVVLLGGPRLRQKACHLTYPINFLVNFLLLPLDLTDLPWL